jgi:hypothetical protein
MLMLLLLQAGNHNELAEVMEKNNSREIIDAAVINTEDEAGIKGHQGRERIGYEKSETRAVMIDTIDAVRPDMKYEAGNKVHQGRELIKHEEPETRDGMINKYGKSEMKALMVDTTDLMLDMEYEAGIKDYQGRKLIIHEKLETRNGMLKTKHKVKYDKNNAVKTQLYEKPGPRDGMLKNNSKPVIESLSEADFENILDNVFGKHQVHEKRLSRIFSTTVLANTWFIRGLG